MFAVKAVRLTWKGENGSIYLVNDEDDKWNCDSVKVKTGRQGGKGWWGRRF